MITFFTDPHIALYARTNTSAKSSPALNEELRKRADEVSSTTENTVCAGDLFHRSSNKETDIRDGIKIASQCDVVVGGNHDFANRADIASSMDLVAAACDSVFMTKTGQVEIFPNLDFDSGERLTIIPHHSSQDYFDEAVKQACQYSGDVVVLHCNYNNPFTDKYETALNLTPDQAVELLKHYQYIVIGHEHQPRVEMDGRLIALGNIHPTGFADISDKYVWTYTKEDGFTRKRVWSKDEGYMRLNAEDIFELPESEFEIEEGAVPPSFVDIQGELDAEHMPELAHRIGLIWDKWQPFMVRNQVNAVSAETHSTMEEGNQIEDFTNKIREGLTDSPKLKALFEDKLAKVSE